MVPFGRLVDRSRQAGRPDLPPLSVFLDEGVVPRSSRTDNYNRLGSNLTKYLVVWPGDIVFNKLRTWQGGLGVSHHKGIVSPAYYVCRPSPRVYPRYLHYLLRSTPYLAELTRVSKFMPPSQFDILWNDLRVLPILVPKIEVQAAIADYLDTETGRIGALISKKRRMIELLEKRLTSLATALVAPERKGQETGIPSIPYAPNEWRVLRNKVFMREVNHRSHSGKEELLSVSHLTGVTPRSEKIVYMFEAATTVGYKLVMPGDLVVNTMWAWMGAAGVSRHHGIVSPSYAVYRIDQTIVLPAYFDLLVRTPAYICEMTRFSRGVTSSRLRLYAEELLALRTPVPPKTDQQEIVGRFARAAQKASSTIEALQRQIDVFTERRQAVITGAVTGQLAPTHMTS